MDTSPEIAEDTTPAGRFGAQMLRRPVLATALAVGLVGSFAGVAAAGTSSTTLSSSSNVAGSVLGALVNIVSTEKYEGAVSAGTGMVLTSNGEILTNNHVINGATSIKVTVVSTGKSYSASVVGTDPTDDVAVIQLSGASGLKTLPIGDSDALKVGQKVVARGNAGGTGTISTVSGTITGLGQSITASSDDGSDAEQLTGLIETDAPIVAGDSGGALATSGKVIGMNTAASVSNSTSNQAYGGFGGGSSSGSGSSSAASEAYAIPIESALTIAQKIVDGDESSTIHIGTQGFLGVELQAAGASAGYGNSRGYGGYGYGFGGDSGDTSGTTTDVAGVTIGGVIAGGAAAAAGLTAVDVITSVNGTKVDSATALSTVMDSTTRGQKVTIGWTDTSGQTHTTQVTLTAGPAD